MAITKKTKPAVSHKQRIRRELTGTVLSSKMNKTIVVKVDRQVQDRMYMKYLTRSKKYKVHDERNEAKEGDLVSLVETRPLSRHKRWALQKVLRQASNIAMESVG